MFSSLFTTNIPDQLRFRSFRAPHIALILAMALLITLVVLWARRRDQRAKDRLLLCCAWSLPAAYVLSFIVFAILEALVEPQMSLLDRLPLQLCTMNAIVMPLGVLKRNNLVLNYMYAICMPGAIAAMLTPAMSYYGKYAWFSWQVIFFFLNHGLMALVSILTIACGYFRPDIRKASVVFGLLCLYALCMYPLNKLTGENFLFLNYPDQGTVMAWFAQYLGNPGYLLPLAGLAMLLVFMLYLPWALADRRNARGVDNPGR